MLQQYPRRDLINPGEVAETATLRGDSRLAAA
jgi:hypothetical protein